MPNLCSEATCKYRLYAKSKRQRVADNRAHGRDEKPFEEKDILHHAALKIDRSAGHRFVDDARRRREIVITGERQYRPAIPDR